MRPAFSDPQIFLGRADRVVAWNRLQRFFGLRLPLAGGRAAVTVTPSDPPPAGLQRVPLAAGGLEATVAFADFPFQALVGIPMQASDLADVAPALRDALISGMVETVATALPDPFRTVRAAANAAEPADFGWAVLTFEGVAPEPIGVYVGASRAAVAEAFADLPEGAVGRGPLLAATPVTASATLLRLGVPRGRMAALAPGRLLVLARDAAARTTLRVGEHAWDFLRSPDGGWQVTRIGRAEPAPVAIERGDGSVSDSAGESGAAALTLPVDFDIGQTTVSLADLDAWRVGSVVGLDLPAPAEGLAVTIRVGGTPVGSGDLVRIEDRLAVRITALWGATA